MNTEQENPTQAEKTLSERLKSAFRAVSPNLRGDAETAFCEFHKINPETFRKKRNGARVATLHECEWMEAWRPAGMPVRQNQYAQA